MATSDASNAVLPAQRENLFSDAGLARATSKAPAISANQDSLHRELLEIFLRNQLKLAPISPLIAILLAATALIWDGLSIVLPWLIGLTGCFAIQLYLCRLYFKQERSVRQQQEWVGMIAASELMQGVLWIVPLFFWSGANGQSAFLVSAIMTVTALRFLVVNSFMPVLVAGTGVMSIGIAARCIAEMSPVYLSLAAMLITLEVLFLFIARQLQETENERLGLRQEKDKLIEELRGARDAAESQRYKAESASKAKSVFLANMSHELRTPLNAIIGFSEVLQRELFGPLSNNAYRDYAQDIHLSGRYLLGIINDILDISRIESGRRELDEKPVALLSLAERAIDILRVAAERKNIELVMEFHVLTPKILADDRALQQVAVNLISNAVKFSPEGGTVAIGAERIGTGEVVFFVRDNGPGMGQDELEHVLEAFMRGKQAAMKAIEGTGLGLSIVNGIMQLHGGRVAIESRPGQGTTVNCVFPAKRVLSGPRAALPETAPTTSDTQQRLISLTG